MTDLTTEHFTLSRRHLLLAGSALSLAAILPTSAFGQEAPVQGGILRARMVADPPSLDPLAARSGLSIFILSPCYSTLVRYDPQATDQIIGDLATDWSVAEDGLSVTFDLVQNAKFHDGQPLTAGDVQFTFDRIRTPPEGVVSVRQGLFGNVDAIETDGDYTVTFRLKQPQASFVELLASAWMNVVPAHAIEAGVDLNENVVGSGPYRLAGFNRGVMLTLERNPDYHHAGLPYFDKIEYYVIPDEDVSLSYLLNGRLDYLPEARGDNAASVEANNADVATGASVFSLNADGLTLNTKVKPFDDIRVREAISLALDREAIMQAATDGAGVVAGFAPPGPWALSEEQLAGISGYGGTQESRLEAARALLAEAGYPDGFQTTVLARRGISLHEARAVMSKSQLADVGIDVTIELAESAAYLEQQNARNFQMITSQVGALMNDPDAIFADYVRTSGTLNFTGLEDANVDDLFARQTVEQDPDSRKQLSDELQLAAMKNYGFLNFYYRSKFLIYRDEIRGVFLTPQTDNSVKLEHVWKA